MESGRPAAASEMTGEAQIFGPDRLLLAGAAAAAVVTYFTFLPSFVFILVGGPLVETTHGDLKFTAPLTGITAAVVGVIVSLALGAAAALVAAVRYKVGLIPLIAISAAAGLALRLAGLA